jgi:hypothetical protein
VVVRTAIACGVFVITEAVAAAIRAIANREGERSAAVELRRRFPGVTDAKARVCVRSIAGWTALQDVMLICRHAATVPRRYHEHNRPLSNLCLASIRTAFVRNPSAPRQLSA